MLNGVDSAHGRAVAGTAQEVSSLSDLSPAFSAMGTQRTTQALPALARELHGHGLLPPEEGLLDGTFASAKKGGLAVGPTKRGKGTKIMAIAAVTSLPLAVTVDRASPHETILLEETLAGSFPTGRTAVRPRTGASCDATSDVGVSSGYLPGCNGSGDWSRATNITSRTFSAWSASAA